MPVSKNTLGNHEASLSQTTIWMEQLPLQAADGIDISKCQWRRNNHLEILRSLRKLWFLFQELLKLCQCMSRNIQTKINLPPVFQIKLFPLIYRTITCQYRYHGCGYRAALSPGGYVLIRLYLHTKSAYMSSMCILTTGLIPLDDSQQPVTFSLCK